MHPRQQASGGYRRSKLPWPYTRVGAHLGCPRSQPCPGRTPQSGAPRFESRVNGLIRGRPSRSETPPERRLVFERHPVVPGATGGDHRDGGSGPHVENASCPRPVQQQPLRWPDPGLRRPTADLRRPRNTGGSFNVCDALAPRVVCSSELVPGPETDRWSSGGLAEEKACIHPLPEVFRGERSRKALNPRAHHTSYRWCL